MKKYLFVLSILLLTFGLFSFHISKSGAVPNLQKTKTATKTVNNSQTITDKPFDGSKPNKDLPKSSFVKPEQLYINVNKDKIFPPGAVNTAQELITYGEYVSKYTPGTGGYPEQEFSKDRMVWVVKIHSPNGLQTTRGFVKNAVVTVLYDAETGDSLGQEIQSLSPHGMDDFFKHVGPPAPPPVK